MHSWTYRLAEPSDAPVFSRWVDTNPQIDAVDVQRTGKTANPMCMFLVACCDGKPVAFAPLYPSLHLAHLAFDPDSRAAEKMKALQVLLGFSCEIAEQLGIREITTLTRSSYPMSRVAERLGFEKDDRELFRFEIPPQSSK